MKLNSPAFGHEGKIPTQYTCDGENINPPLSILEAPGATQSLVLIMEDPDVPKNLKEDGMWDHWVVFNIPPDLREILEGKEPEGTAGTGTNGELGYYGPCPPDREHRYFFKLFALDTKLELPEGATKPEVEKAMNGHILDETHLMGRYERK
ncbi:MAG: YbhB/YbcL family Raf kinase inhibitor-like protein [Desulfatiglandaceae bacterium]